MVADPTRLIAAQDPSFAEKCVDEVHSAGGRAEPFTCDVTDEPRVRETVDAVVRRLGGVDVLLNGVALRIGKGVLDTSLDEWRRQLDVILTGAFLFAKTPPLRPEQERDQQDGQAAGGR